MHLARPARFPVLICGFALSLRSSAGFAQSHDVSDYALLAATSINANGLTISDGDVAVLDGFFASSHTLAAASSTIAAPLVRLDQRSTCGALLATTTRGAVSTCGPAKPFAKPFASIAATCGFPSPFPACDPSHAPIVVPHGGSIALPPGAYGEVVVEGGAGGPGTLLLAGTYAFCDLRASRDGQVAFRGPSTVYVRGSLTASTGADVGPLPGSGVSAGQVHVFVAGSLVRISRKGSLGATVCAPSAILNAGTSATLEGSFAAAALRFKRTVVQFVAPDTTATTTTTTLPPASVCGDGIVGPGEVCDGDVTCTSPGGSFLTCSGCAAFVTGPCTPSQPPAPRCGNGHLDPGEQCDDGNTADCDGCSAHCTIEEVGNGVIDCDEECDDGNTANCDGCDANGELECGNGVIDTECGEVCDGTDLGGRTCPGGTPICAPDCRSIDSSGCPIPPREICGNCIDDDGNGLVDFEDPACCGEAQAFAGTLRHARLKARRHGGTLVRLRGQLGGPGLAVTPASENVFLQIRADDAGELLCAELPAGKFRQHHGAFRFRDRKHLLASARAIDAMRLKPMPGGIVRGRTVGRGMDFRMPSPGGLRVTLGFTDPAAGDSSNRCAVMGGTLRAARKGGLRYP